MKGLRYGLWGIFAALFAATAAFAWWSHAEEREREDGLAVKAWLPHAVIPTLQLHDQTVADAVAVLNRVIEVQEGHPKGLRIVIASDEESKKAVRRPLNASTGVPGIPASGEGIPAMPPPGEERLTVSLDDIPLNEALMYVAGLTHRKQRIHGRTITLYRCDDGCTVDPLVTWELRMPKDLMGMPTDKPDQWVDCTPFLTANGIVIYEGGYARWHARKGALRIRTTEEAFDVFSHAPAPMPSLWEQWRTRVCDLFHLDP